MANEEVPVVAVVGRPNVGKSTLVNRVLGSRLAVVEDTPGVTRDRVAYDAMWHGRAFTLVDTGGWEPSEGEDRFSLAARIAAQARIAASAADAVLFVVDATVGATDTDEAVADVLRRSGVPVVVAANKVDNAATELTASALWSLGLGEPRPVSALHGRGSGDLLDAVLDALPETPPQPHTAPSGPRRVALLGKPNVGKSSLLNKLAGEQRVLVDDVAGTTRDPVDELIELGGKTWRFVDTAGIRRRFRENQGADYYAALRTAGALDVAEVAVVLVDASEPLTEQDLRIISMVIEAGRALVIAFNKWDLVDEERQHYLEREIDRQLHNARWAPRVNISATNGRHVDRLVPGDRDRAGRLGDADVYRPAERVAEWPDRGDPAAGARRAAAQGAVRHPGRHPAAALRPVHLRVPRGVLPPVRGAAAARGVRLRRQPAQGLDARPGEARGPQAAAPPGQRQPPLRRWTCPFGSRTCSSPTAGTYGIPTARCPAGRAAGGRVRVRRPAAAGRRSGAELVDGMSSWWAAIHGYRHPVLDAAAADQLGRMSHVMFGGLTHEPAVRLCERLAALAPNGLEHVFLCDSGSVSVEVAVKMCLQYWRSAGRPGQAAAADLARRLPRGHVHGHVGVRSRGRHAHDVGRGGGPPAVRPGPAGWSRGPRIRRHPGRADRGARGRARRGDRRAGGPGRGRDAFPRSGLPAGDPRRLHRARRTAGLRRDRHRLRPHRLAVRRRARPGQPRRDVRRQGADRRVPDAGRRAVHPGRGVGHLAGSVPVLAHGPTFMGNPLACAVALASLSVLHDPRWYPGGWRASVARLEAGLGAGLAPARGWPGVADVRVLGAIGVVQLTREVDVAAATAAAVRAGVWLRPFRDLIYTMPPYITSDEDLALICRGVLAAVDAAASGQ